MSTGRDAQAVRMMFFKLLAGAGACGRRTRARAITSKQAPDTIRESRSSEPHAFAAFLGELAVPAVGSAAPEVHATGASLTTKTSTRVQLLQDLLDVQAFQDPSFFSRSGWLSLACARAARARYGKCLLAPQFLASEAAVIVAVLTSGIAPGMVPKLKSQGPPLERRKAVSTTRYGRLWNSFGFGYRLFTVERSAAVDSPSSCDWVSRRRFRGLGIRTTSSTRAAHLLDDYPESLNRTTKGTLHGLGWWTSSESSRNRVAYVVLYTHPAAMGMLSDEPMRSSLQVAPLTIQKTRSESIDNGSDLTASSNLYSQSQMTPPITPNGSQEDLHEPEEDAPPVFHNFLRAFYPFHPSYHMMDSTVTLPLNEGDVILVHSIHTNGWADGTLLVSGARGWLPTNYCEAYDPEEMRNLLKALLNFWDLMRSTAIDDSEMFGNQEFMKGIIAGVRYLLERTNCLTRESALIQRHDGLRRSRKSLLSELSSLVKTAKRLQEAQRIGESEDEVNRIIDEMILKAFKIITKGVRFLDILEDDRRLRAPAVTVMATVMEEAYIPPTPPADTSGFNAGHGYVRDVGFRADGNGYGDRYGEAAEAAASEGLSEASRVSTPANRRLSSACSTGTNVRRLSQSNGLQANRRSSSISHRVSLAGPSPLSRPQNLVSERLGSCHDLFLSHLSACIGRLQVQSQSRPHLALAVRQSVSSGGELLLVVDVVCAHNSVGIEALNQSRAVMYDRIKELIHTASDILTSAGPEAEDVIVPQDNGRLLGAATGCVKASGECVAKTKWVIERIGDFEYDFESGSFAVDFDLSALDMIPEERDRSNALDSASIAESSVSEAMTTASTTISTTVSTAGSIASSAVGRPKALPIDKPLPEVPQLDEPIEEEPVQDSHKPESHDSPSPPASRPQSPVAEDAAASSVVSSVSSLRPSLPPLPKISTALPPAEDYSPTEQSTNHEGEFHSFRSQSMTASSAGSGSTYLSRASESSLVSQTSTRATTPDNTPAPREQPSLSELSAAGSLAQTEEVDDVESKLLAKTYAHELMFNKEGQVTGGTLAALVERLTTHESTPDAMFVSTFYLTFRLFCTPTQLAEALIDRFEYVGEAPHVAAPVRLRTYNVFKGWLESHWREESDHEALDLIKHFAEFQLGSTLPSAGKRLLELTEKVSCADGNLVPRLVSSMGKTSTSISQYIPADTPLPPSILTKSQMHALAGWKANTHTPSILDFDPLEIARQLTIKQMALYCSIMPEELLGSKWTKFGGAGAPNVKAMSAFTTGLSNLVADTILHYEEVKKRAIVIKQWIKIANQCLSLHNYDALMAITCALTDTSIKRLRITWDSVSVKRKEMLKALQAIVDFNQNYKVLRGRLHDHVPPCLPFLGMFLTDLTFVDVGNPATKSSDTGLTVINFDKHTRTAKIIGELQRFQIPYRLTEIADLQAWLHGEVFRIKDKEKTGSNAQTTHYRKSLLLEPREMQQLRQPIDALPGTSAVTTGMFGWMRSNNTSHSVPAQS
ncbi:ras guanine nucleotide exchange factor A [Diplogelasinospora grovesii]|uniref:Ras guanine nucleotide exchange factor A n=1 Tax=Diplogelasinospora grovesii TaxID=303347 RepID=A0AAN6S495_9PEZI|nr:ras guanine nucleotide exchange factor A [Diplogelasinospora grovesii]